MNPPPRDFIDMATEKVVRTTDADFSAMISCVTADALYAVRPTTRRWLRSREGHLLWLDALHAADIEHLVRSEHMRYHRHPDAKQTRHELEHIRRTIREAESLHDRYEREERETSTEYQNQRDPHHVARIWLARHHWCEYDQLLRRLTAEAGLPRHLTPRHHDQHDEIEHACHTGLLHAPLNRNVRGLIGGPYTHLCHAVIADARDEERNIALRHPLALRRWHLALEDLLRRTHERALAPSIHTLGDVGVHALRRLGDERADEVLRCRRFFGAVRQRHIEHHHTRRTLSRATRERRHHHARPWYRARDRALDEVARRHPEQYHFVHCRLLALVGAGDGTLHYAPTGRNTARREAKTQIMHALANGTWHTATP